MTPQARRIWASKQGQSLLRAFLEGRELTPIEREASNALRDLAPSKATSQPPKSQPKR